MVGANGFEPSTSWSRTRHLNPINALFGVAYGTRSVISPLSVVPNLYLEWHCRICGSVPVLRQLKNAHRAPLVDTACGWVCKPCSGLAFCPSLPAPPLRRSRKQEKITNRETLKVELHRELDNPRTISG